MVFARNCAKGPKPTMPIFRFLEAADCEDETDMVKRESEREREREREMWVYFRLALL
jgi:hypothetical protein